MSHQSPSAAMRNRLRAVQDGESNDDHEPRPFEDYFRELVTLEAQKQAVGDNIKALLEAAKRDKIPTRALREVLRISKMEPDERDLRFSQLVTGLKKVGIHLEIGFAEFV